MQTKDFDSFFERLREQTDISTQAQLARELGVGRAAVSLVKKKGAVPPRWILDLSVRYNIDSTWLESGLGLPHSEESAEAFAEDFTRVPKVAARLSAGGGSFETGGEIEGYYAFHKNWISSKGNPANMVLMEVYGNSMEPELKAGDIVLLDQSKQSILAGGIYAIGVEDTVMVKRVEKRPGQVVLHSDNTDYSPIFLGGDELENVRVLGQVVWASREYQ
ncbi:helix-turn-helix transcriptional regulator [Maridesulfovibrio ferrireducens]|uniref:Phage repressor protein C, contains Cro/C1-type HTH and peptisase s24 domains n=1 Tax=Maridesulfovibrio ferrireducens TaxID=246191 RepID=A0A1G9J146_9BACT|nr:helix-turn-helix transcriptional regulator [Maridesulfovibrio ferrireducens]MBI9112544.1 helix-turn-helix transcriptional regulator [Maridesulfovibrio ferrireducens]SDL31052.1 Phage repressor protein C, contains Cro/C1-type HTH and peptisase s24 domains [Maridesulfovibrio ferrireducens]